MEHVASGTSLTPSVQAWASFATVDEDPIGKVVQPRASAVSEKSEGPRVVIQDSRRSCARNDFEKVIGDLLSTLQIQLIDEFRRAVAERDVELVQNPRRPRADRTSALSTLTGEGIRTPAWIGCSRSMPSTASSARVSQTALPSTSYAIADWRGFLGFENNGQQDFEAGSAAKEDAPAVAIREFFMDPGKSTTRMGTMFRSFDKGRSTNEAAPNKYIMRPNSKVRVSWEITSVFLVMYDAVMTPWIVAWNPQSYVYQAISIATLIFWGLDMVLNFFTGYFRQGEIVMQRRDIAINYLKTWFFVDVAIISVDIITLLFEIMIAQDDSWGYRVTPTAMRVLRLLKVGKLLRVIFFMSSWRDRTRSIVTTSARVFWLGVKLVVILLWLNHVICCTWFFIGTSSMSDTGNTWLDMETPTGSVPYREVGHLFQYAISLHWSITQMTPGSMGVVPQNTYETFFNVVILLIGLFVGALLVSQLSARMVKMQLENQEQTKRMSRLHTYLRENNIGWSLRSRVQAQILDRLDVDRRLTVKDVDLVKFLSLSLRKELCFESFAHHITTHTLFHAWGALHVKLLESICLQAAELVCLAKDDDLFTPHSVANTTYLILKGALRYGGDQEESRGTQFFTEMLQEGEDEDELDERMEGIVRSSTWVSEAAIWLECSYSGTLTSLTPCELLAIDVPSLLGILKKYPRVRALNHHYGAAFYRLMTAGDPDSRWDIGVNGEHLLMSMPKEYRMEVMEPIVRTVFPVNDSRWNVRTGDRPEADLLMKELSEGNAIMSLIRGRVTRTVLLVTLRVERKNGMEVLVRLARRRGNQLVPSVMLPGTKMKQGEGPNQAFKRLLKEELIDFPLNISGMTTRLETHASKTFKIRSRYMNSTFHANLEGENTRRSLTASAPRPLRASRRATSRMSTQMSLRVSAFFSGKNNNDGDSPTTIMGRLDMADGFLVDKGEEQCLYGWVAEPDLDLFNTPKGQDILRTWVSSNEGRVRVVKALAEEEDDLPNALSL